MPSARGIHHLAIRVADLPRMERFYGEVLELGVLRRWPAADGAGDRSVWMDTGDGSFLALETVTVPAGERGVDAEARPGLHLVALRVTAGDRARWEARLGAAGVAIERRTAFTLYVRDPEGNRVGLSHHPEVA